MRGVLFFALLFLFVVTARKVHDVKLDIQTKKELIETNHVAYNSWGFVHCSREENPPGCIVDSGKQDFILTFTPVLSHVVSQRHTRFYYYFPQNYADRVMYLFHGRGGHAADWFTNVEMSNFTNYVVAMGFAVVVLDSDERRTADNVFSRNSAADNPDYQNVQFTLEYLKGLELINLAHTTAYYATGLNYGAEFAQVLAQQLSFNGVVLFGSSPFIYALREPSYRTPTTWVRGPHDTIKPHGGSVADVRQAYDLLVSKNVSTQLCIYPSLPLKSVHNSYFTLVPGVGLEVSQELFKYLQHEGVIDEKLFVVQNPETLSEEILKRIQELIPRDRGQKRDGVVELLVVAYGDNAVISDFAFDIFNFLAGRPQWRRCLPSKPCYCTQFIPSTTHHPPPPSGPSALQNSIQSYILDALPYTTFSDDD